MNKDFRRAKGSVLLWARPMQLVSALWDESIGALAKATAKADEMQQKLTHLSQESVVTVPIKTTDLGPIPTEHCKGLKTRERVEQRILEMLKDDQVYAVGIYGMGGIGILKSCIVDRVNRVYSLIKNHKSNLNQLQDIHCQLRAKKDDIAGKVENGKSKLKQVTNEARDWLQSAEKLLENEQVKNLMNEDYIRAKDQCCCGLFLCNLYQRYVMSQWAKAKTDKMPEKLNFHNIQSLFP